MSHAPIVLPICFPFPCPESGHGFIHSTVVFIAFFLQPTPKTGHGFGFGGA